MAKAIYHAELDEEVAALDAHRQLPPDRLHVRNERWAVIMDQAGVIILAERRPNQRGKIQAKLIMAIAPIHASDVHYKSSGWKLETLCHYKVSEAKLTPTIERFQLLAEQLHRLRFGGWHFSHRPSALQIFNPLAPGQAYQRTLEREMTNPKSNDWGYLSIRWFTRRLRAIPTIPQRRAMTAVSEQIDRLSELATPDLTGLVQARWPNLTGLELAAAISQAFDRYSAGSGLTEAIEHACQPVSE